MPFDFDDYVKNMVKNEADIPIWIGRREEEAKKHPVMYR